VREKERKREAKYKFKSSLSGIRKGGGEYEKEEQSTELML